jgi:hypothetical protein
VPGKAGLDLLKVHVLVTQKYLAENAPVAVIRRMSGGEGASLPFSGPD